MCVPIIGAIATVASTLVTVVTAVQSASDAKAEKQRLVANEFEVSKDLKEERQRSLARSLAGLEATSGGYLGGTVSDVRNALDADANRDFRRLDRNSQNRIGDINFAADQQKNAAIFGAVGAVTRGVGQVAGALRTPTSTDTGFDFGSGRPISYGDGDDDYRQLSRGGFFSAS